MNVSGIGLAILLLVSGGIGVPVGIPPAPEDPLMARVIPGDALLVASWAGVAPLDPAADPTQKWMAQAEIKTFTAKLVEAMKSRALGKGGSRHREQTIAVKELLTKVTEASFGCATTIYVKNFDVDGGQPEPFRAAAVVALKDQKRVVADLLKEIPTAEVQDRISYFSRVERDGVERLSYRDPRSKLVTEVAIWKDYFIIGMGEGELDQVIVNSQTDPPDWYTDYRKQLPVKKFCSMSYVAKDTVLKFPRGAWLSLGWRPLDSFRGMFMVSGLDEKGMITRGKIEVDFEGEGIEDLIQAEPLDDKYFARLPERPTVSASVKVSIEEVIQNLAGMGDNIGQDLVEEADQRVRKEFDFGLKEELQKVLDGHVGFHYTLDADRPFNQVVTTIGIEDDMSFPALYDTVLKTIKKWDADSQLTVVEHGLYEIYSYPIVRNFWGPRSLVWSHVKEELIFGTDVDSVKLQIDRALAGRTFADTDSFDDLVQFGKRNQFGNPVLLGTIDLATVARELVKFLSLMGVGDNELIGGLKFKDIPDVDILTNGVEPNVLALYRANDGFQLYGHQTLPGASPVASLLAAGSVFGVTELDRFVVNETLVSQNHLRQLGLACLNFESAFASFPATGTKSPAGKPLLSWRVHILPFIEEVKLYEQFHLDEPWDSPHNETLIAQMPKVFKHPSLALGAGKTVYLGVAGESAVLGGLSEKNAGSGTFGNITDGSSNTILVVECGKSAAEVWTKPVDLSTDGERAVAATKDTLGGAVNVVMCDSSVHRVKRMSADVWSRLLNMRDGQVESIEDHAPDAVRP